MILIKNCLLIVAAVFSASPNERKLDAVAEHGIDVDGGQTKRGRHARDEPDMRPHLISYPQFTRRWDYITPRVRQEVLKILRKEFERRIKSSRPKSPHAIRRFVSAQIQDMSRDMSDYKPKSGKLVLEDPRMVIRKHENDVEDFLQYLFFKRQILKDVHDELVRISNEKVHVSADEIIHALDRSKPDLFVSDRYCVEDIVDWYINVAMNHEVVADMGNGWVQMTDGTFVSMLDRFLSWENSDNRMNRDFVALQEIPEGMSMAPIDLLRAWKRVHLFGKGESVEISDGLAGVVPEKSEIIPEGPLFPLDIVKEWKRSPAHRQPLQISDAVSDNLRNILFPLRFPSMAIPEDEHAEFLLPLLRLGTEGFPFDESIFTGKVSAHRRAQKFTRILSSVSQYALIDAEVYTTLRSLYTGIGVTAKASRGVLLENVAAKCESAQSIANHFKTQDPIKYAYLTANHVAVWAQFVLHDEPEEFEEIQEIRKFSIRVSGGIRTILFMESHFFKFLEFVLTP